MTVIAAMTAFYMFRLYYGIFWSDKRSAANDEHSSHNAHHTPHESPLTMTVPLMFLALVTIVAGFIPFGHFVSSNGEAYTIHLDWGVAGTSIAIAVISIALATYMYKSGKQQVANALARRFNGLWAAAYHRFYSMKSTSHHPPHHLRLYQPPDSLVGPPCGGWLLRFPCLGR